DHCVEIAPRRLQVFRFACHARTGGSECCALAVILERRADLVEADAEARGESAETGLDHHERVVCIELYHHCGDGVEQRRRKILIADSSEMSALPAFAVVDGESGNFYAARAVDLAPLEQALVHMRNAVKLKRQ